MKPSFDLKCTCPLTVIRQSTCSSFLFNFSSPYPNSFFSMYWIPLGFRTPVRAPHHPASQPSPQTPGAPPPSSARQRGPTCHSPTPPRPHSPTLRSSIPKPRPCPPLLIQTSLQPPPCAGSGPPSRPILNSQAHAPAPNPSSLGPGLRLRRWPHPLRLEAGERPRPGLAPTAKERGRASPPDEAARRGAGGSLQAPSGAVSHFVVLCRLPGPCAPRGRSL